MTSTPRIPPRSVVLLVPDGSQLIGLVGFAEAFDIANRFLASRGRGPLYAVRVAALGGEARGAVVALAGSEAASIAKAHTLVVGGLMADEALGEGPRLDPDFVAQVRRLAAGAERVVSLCMGAFALGEAGLLDGRRCTTHWLGVPALARRFPTAQVDEDALYTEDGRIFTSAGATAGIDLALHLIRRDGGPKLALAVARALVVFAQRPGGQSQFATGLRLQPSTDERLRGLVAGIQRDPGADHRVQALAERVGMSPRHFARVFREQTGETPAAFVARARVEAAQRALAQSDVPLAALASDLGFGTEETLRRTFHRVAGVAPSAWRARFGGRGPTAG